MDRYNISRRDFLKNAAVGAAGVATLGVMVACGNTAESTGAESAAPKERYIPGTYTSTQKTDFATVVVTGVFDSTALTGLSYEVTETSDSDYFQTFSDAVADYCSRIVEAGSTVDVDGVSGATLCSTAIKDGVNSCIAQAMGITVTAADAPVTELNPQDESYDTYTTDYSAIFTPIQVGHMTLRNRIVKSAAGSDTQPKTATEVTQNTIDYYGRFADGGTALVILEGGTISNFGFKLGSTVEGDDLESGMEMAKKLTDRIHQGGAYVGFQVCLGGPLEAPKVNEYSIDDLHNLLAQYGELALRLKQAGVDCIELKGSTTDGLNAFLSRRINQREDEYGPQNNENRARFFIEIVKSMREACGDDFSVLSLINAIEENDGALGQNDKYITIEESKAVAKLLEEAGVASIQIRMGASTQEINCWGPDCAHTGYKMDGATGSGTIFDYTSHFEGMLDGSHSGAGAFIPAAMAIKSVVSIPVGCAGYADPRTAPDMMNNAVANGDIDLIFMNRPLTVDPELPNKLQAGLRDEVAPCTRCLHCHGKPYGEAESCRVNATTQFAYTEEMPEGYDTLPAETVKNVLVIGGGPAGMEAARVAAERGHTVTLYEEQAALGGMLPFAAAVKGPHERLEDLRSYLIRQQDLKGVTVVTGQKVDADFVVSQNPDAVVVAVGGLRDSKLSGSGSPAVVAMDDVLGSEIGKNVVILGAGAQATDLAVYLLAQDRKIQIVHGGTPDDVDKEQSFWIKRFIRGHIYAHGVKVWNGSTVNGIVSGGLSITTDSGNEKTLSCDTIIECYDMLANTSLYDSIAAAGYEVYAVGDCNEPYNIQRAIHAGNITARKI